MLELNRFVVYVHAHANKWKSIGLELDIEFDTLEEIERTSDQQNIHCFRRVLNMWLKNVPNPTWNSLEVAITNANRIEIGLHPVSSIYGKVYT